MLVFYRWNRLVLEVYMLIAFVRYHYMLYVLQYRPCIYPFNYICYYL